MATENLKASSWPSPPVDQSALAAKIAMSLLYDLNSPSHRIVITHRTN
ncbi:MAG: hypothetical protein M0019_05720 [Actinomycetota bacterium]|nr:hypothetical protein [Actinomycetota bacterium]